MSTIAVPHPKPRGLADDDPYRYGWRDVREVATDGTVTFKQIPLTLDDCLHPQMGDVIVENLPHDLLCTYLKNVFRDRLKDDPHALVLGDTGVYWDEKALKHHSPDVAVILDVRELRQDYSAFHVAEEGTRPSLIIEVVSPSTRSNDVETKVGHYHRVRVPVYVIVDRVDDRWQLIGYQYSPTEYLPMPFDKAGRLWLEAGNVFLGLKDGEVVLYDGATGREIGDYSAVRSQRDDAVAQADMERQRADSERLRAEGEAAARAAAEARVRELEEALRRG